MPARPFACASVLVACLSMGGLLAGECPTCRDTGEATCVSCLGARPDALPCLDCKGEGSFPCRACGGTGGSTCTTCSSPSGQTDRAYATTKENCGVCDRSGTLDCPSCVGGRIECAACRGRREVARLCLACEGRGKVACPTCRADGPCAGCAGKKKVDCVACELSGARAATCSVCLGSRGVLCPTCKGTGRAECGQCHGDGVRHGARGAYGCDRCGRRGYVACETCRGRAATPCGTCKGKGQVVEKCAACGGAKKAACPACRTGRAWTGTDPRTGAVVWLFPLEGWEPQVAACLRPALAAGRPAWRLVVDARAASQPVDVGREGTGLELSLVQGTSVEIAIVSAGEVPGLPKALERAWVPEGATRMPVTVRRAELGTWIVCAASAPPAGTLRIRMRMSLDGTDADADLKSVEIGARDRLRLLMAPRAR